jgi:hypothetical protein
MLGGKRYNAASMQDSEQMASASEHACRPSSFVYQRCMAREQVTPCSGQQPIAEWIRLLLQ